MQIKNLSPNPKNPRSISDAKLKQLKKALKEFGDLSGFVFNKKSRQLVSGHQRSKIFDPSAIIEIVKTYSKPTKTGTVAEGHVELNGERHKYREVYWPEAKEKAALIAANKAAGSWNDELLAEALESLSSLGHDFDIELTMFDKDELSNLPSPIMVGAHTRSRTQGDKEDDEDDTTPAKCKAGEVYALGETRIKCGADDLKYCDLIISRWEKYSGEKSILQTKVKIRSSDNAGVRHRKGTEAHG